MLQELNFGGGFVPRQGNHAESQVLYRGHAHVKCAASMTVHRKQNGA